MARQIVVDQDFGYRAVHIRYSMFTKERTTIYEGIYNAPGTAKARVSFWRNHLGEDFVDGWIEKAHVTWGRV